MENVLSPSMTLGVSLLLTVGFYVSWRRRHKRNIPLKTLIAALTLVALFSFLQSVYRQPYDPRLPMAELFVWVQVLHAFDLPRRRDLIFSLVSSLVLLSIAASFALSMHFAWIALLWLCAALPSLYLAQASRLAELSRGDPPAPSDPRPPRRKLLLRAAAILLLVLVLGTIVGAIMPRAAATYLRYLPSSLRRAAVSLQGTAVINPGYPPLPSNPPGEALSFNPDAYFGFNPFLDLRARGRLSDDLVMKVRSTMPAYWRGLSFVEYNGYAWLLSDEQQALKTPSQPFVILYQNGEMRRTGAKAIQTFYMESDDANVIFAAYRPNLVYFPSDYIYRGEAGLRSPFPLSKGLVYSVVSDIVLPDEAAVEIKEASGDYVQPYLQLPALPRRVVDLAERIAPRDLDPLQRADAIERFLRDNYSYSLDVPPLPPGADAVDTFLFEHRKGTCEHFASAYVVLCRLAGIPARIVVGYAAGEYNPFSGLYEVKRSDAHAWAEIYIDGLGWLTREPTQGFTLPDPRSGSGSLWILGDLLAWMGKKISSVLPPSVRSALASGWKGFIEGASSAWTGFTSSVRTAPWLAVLFLLSVVAPLLLRPRLRSRRPGKGSVPPRREAAMVLQRFLEEASRLGLEVLPHLTLREIRERLSALAPGVDISGEVASFESSRYGGRELSREELDRLEEGLGRALEEMRKRRAVGDHP
jgi:transglutaminase-like putative cysteine protease